MKQHDVGDLVTFQAAVDPGKEMLGIVVSRFWEPDSQTWYCTCYFGEHGSCDCEESTLKSLTKSDQQVRFYRNTKAVEVKHGD